MKWTEINESMLSSRETSSFESDMTELEASMAISEAISFSAEAKYMAKGIISDICALNEKAEANDYSVTEYIEESFMVGGIIIAVIGLLILAFKSLASAGKAVVKNTSSLISSVSKSGPKGKSLGERFRDMYDRSIPYVNFTSKLPDHDVLHYLIGVQSISAILDLDVYNKDQKLSYRDTSINQVMNRAGSVLWNPDEINEKNCKDVLEVVESTSKQTSNDGITLLKNVIDFVGKKNRYHQILIKEHDISSYKYKDLDIYNFKGNISGYLKNIQKYIDVKEEDFDRVKLDKVLKSLGDSTMMLILDTNVKITNDSIKAYESYILQLERAKSGLKLRKEKFSAMDSKEMVDAMNKINTCLLTINSAVTDYQTNFSIPGFTLMKLGCQNLIKFADDCEKAFKDADAASNNPGKDKTHEDIQKDAEEFMDDLADPKKKTVKF